MSIERWVGAVHKQLGAYLSKGSGRTKRDGAVYAFRCSVHPGSLGSIEWHLFAILREKILAKEFAKVLKQISKAANDWEISSHSLCFLSSVDNIDDSNREHAEAHENQE